MRQRLAAMLVGAGFEPTTGDRLEDALAGEAVDGEAAALASAMTEAEKAFGALDCKLAIAASQRAIGIAAQRQAGKLAVPELPRAWTYVLLCADRASDVDLAMSAARHLRSAGGSTDVPADVWTKYPDLDVVPDRELVELEITADVPGAQIWVDFRPVGAAPARVTLALGDHYIAAAAGMRRGWAAGKAVASQKTLAIPTKDQSAPWAEVGARVAGWKGQMPAPQELGWVMAKVRARVALVRRGDRVEAIGRIGLAEAPHRLGGEDGVVALDDVDKLAPLITERVHGWNDRAPDPDRPLLLDDQRDGGKHRDLPTKWWVYASIAGAIVGGALLIYVNDARSDSQRVELHQP
ncbi:MAG: hypothetical protein ABI867_22460 [Kofleriaceae bacterium]